MSIASENVRELSEKAWKPYEILLKYVNPAKLRACQSDVINPERITPSGVCWSKSKLDLRNRRVQVRVLQAAMLKRDMCSPGNDSVRALSNLNFIVNRFRALFHRSNRSSSVRPTVGTMNPSSDNARRRPKSLCSRCHSSNGVLVIPGKWFKGCSGEAIVFEVSPSEGQSMSYDYPAWCQMETARRCRQ